MFKTKIILLGAAAAASLGSAAPAFARHGHFTRVEGRFGRGYVHGRSVARAPGSVSVNRGTQTNGGYGIATDRNASWGGGTYAGNTTHTLNNGDTFGRSTSVTRNGDGSASYKTTRTAVDGHTTTVSGALP